ncbi:RNA polymerase II Rpb4 [Carpediemonas membranifera]|uniref:RNA polymerase II Rpb4 n=1 Tax=Carpediemonas membranifera TaxID=201153 RepID=A0A8J6E0L7_9EUKA|nr:RNA polymerase II Rpb4 [Carpediemonas membranifera]|eukprot:KAG9392393.1 RNA polymerase II Rpb4 [Carpediemonas membranifera]
MNAPRETNLLRVDINQAVESNLFDRAIPVGTDEALALLMDAKRDAESNNSEITSSIAKCYDWLDRLPHLGDFEAVRNSLTMTEDDMMQLHPLEIAQILTLLPHSPAEAEMLITSLKRFHELGGADAIREKMEQACQLIAANITKTDFDEF